MIETDKFKIKMEEWAQILIPHTKSKVIFSVPHDGQFAHESKGLFGEREVGNTLKDGATWNMVRDIVLEFPASVIRGLMSRSYVDYNRSWPEAINYYPLTREKGELALNDESLLPVYEYYHKELENFIKESIENFWKEKILLIDFHGFTNQPKYAPESGYDIILGTGNRKTIFYDDIDIKLYEFLSKKYSVFLPKKEATGELEDEKSGDFIVRNYAEKFKINAIQIEVHNRFRTYEGMKDGEELARDIAEFLKENY